MIRRTATPAAPWYVVPADNKWFTRIVVAAAIVDALAGLKLEYPAISKSQREEIERAKEVLGDGTSQGPEEGRQMTCRTGMPGDVQPFDLLLIRGVNRSCTCDRSGACQPCLSGPRVAPPSG